MNGGKELFYETLKEICEKKKTTPSAVCVALGMSKSSATKWKNGSSPNLDTVVAVAKHLGVSPARFLPKVTRSNDADIADGGEKDAEN
jgi:transcriptional regulator with XRE-family HTH domain